MKLCELPVKEVSKLITTIYLQNSILNDILPPFSYRVLHILINDTAEAEFLLLSILSPFLHEFEFVVIYRQKSAKKSTPDIKITCKRM
jgi:hypothetical protein